MSDRIFASILIAVCVLIGWQMWRLNVPFAYEPVGPKAFPGLLAGLMALCCLALLADPDRDIEWPPRPLLAKGAALIATLVAYAELFESGGFPLTTFVMVLLLARLFGGNWKSALGAAFLVGVLGYVLFDRVLQVTLPLGRLWS